jgi:hypothetical protein
MRGNLIFLYLAYHIEAWVGKMGTYYYGIIAEIKKANGDAVMFVGKNFWEPESEYLAKCSNLLKKIRALRGKPNWYCSTLRQINEIIQLSERCPPKVLLYLLIAESLGIQPEIVSEYDRGYDEDRQIFDVSYASEVEEICKYFFEKRRVNKTEED